MVVTYRTDKKYQQNDRVLPNQQKMKIKLKAFFLSFFEKSLYYFNTSLRYTDWISVMVKWYGD